ncbi:MAG: serine/threonine protein kinase [Gammaproteobacteria bacterium]|nr:serine/threonine protein kinase [Gammaproteobacteria bacterium]
MTAADSHPYSALLPDLILDAIDAIDNRRYRTSGSMLALNSYENRVYQVGLESGQFIVAKFYRPGRWSDAAIREEHAFAAQLAKVEVPVVAPLADDNGETLHTYEGFRFALFARRGGHWPELDDPDTQYRLGQFLGRIHAMGATRPFAHRPAITPETFGDESLSFLLANGFLPRDYEQQYRDLAEGLLAEVRARFAAVPYTPIRLHGDFHPGNILWTDRGAHLVDLDDCRMGPAVQDLWMLLSGERAQMNGQLSELLAGYEEFYDFDHRELALIESLRTLRLLHYSAWLARRWDDPAFPQAFPWFNTVRYWEEQVLTLREQQLRLTQPALLSSGE